MGGLGIPERLLQDSDEVFTVIDSRMRMGDDARWATPTWEDSDWASFTEWYYSPASDTTAQFWTRIYLDIHEENDTLSPKGIQVSALASFELYWDGHLIGRSGTVGSNLATEVPGLIDNLFLIPDSLFTSGRHVLAMRLSNFHVQQRIRYYYDLNMGDYATMARNFMRDALLPLFFLGGFCIIGIYYLLLYLITTRQLSLLLFSLLCFSVSVLLVAESWRAVLGYTFEWHYIRLLVVTATTFVTGLLLPSFFLVHFGVPKKRYWLVLLIGLLVLSVVLPESYTPKSALLFICMMAFSASIAVWAIWKQKEGSTFALAGVSLCAAFLILDLNRFIEYTFFLTFGGLIVCLLASLSVQAKKQRAEHEKALVNSARLELELLKKNIQPHFLMNSLTSMMEWIEEDPKTGVQLIEALANEFRILMAMSGKRLIPIAHEIDLCHSHLSIMSYRRDIQFDLSIVGINYDERVPPALFHTLLENGITHNAYEAESVCFHLRGEQIPHGRRYVVLTPSDGTARSDKHVEGTGLRYVKTRLTESFGENWQLTSESSPEGWVTTIAIYE